MNSLKIIQYLPLVRPRAIKKLIPLFSKKKINLILDLEDSAQDIFDIKKTNLLKKKSREGLSYLSSSFANYKFDCEIYIRINGIHTKYFIDDLLIIKEALTNNFPIKGIFLPKIESYDQILQFNNDIIELNKDLVIVPMFESNLGILNLKDILMEDKKKIIQIIHYGHFDYCLDNKIWPFTYPNNFEYWEVVKKIISVCNQFDVDYVHTPFPFVNNIKMFWEMANYLSNLIKENKNFYLSTVNTEISFSQKKEEYKFLEINSSKIVSDFEKIEEAKKIIDLFENKKINSRSFSKSNELFIPPHQYILAKKILKMKNND